MNRDRQPPGRKLSPGRKPENPPDASEQMPIPTPRPKEKPKMLSLQPGFVRAADAISPVRRPSPLTKTKGPSLVVQPPQSPPRCSGDLAVGENPDLATDSSVKTLLVSTPRLFKIPSRPNTPILMPRSPRTPSQPPSPPPPRRSAELRRAREESKAMVARRAVTAAGTAAGPAAGPTSDRKEQEHESPFSSPVSSQGTAEAEERPPELPKRPPARPRSMQSPARPPRSGKTQKRVVSIPTSDASDASDASNYSSASSASPVSPRRRHGRSMTVDTTCSRAPSELRSAISLPPHHPIPQPATPPLTSLYPDASNTNRSRPCAKMAITEIPTKYDSRVLDVCGELVCTTGTYTRVWSLSDGELRMSLAMGEGIKGTAVALRPGAHVDEEGQKVWIGNSNGHLMEADIATQTITGSQSTAHRHEISRIYRHSNQLWTLDDGGTLNVWAPNRDGVPTLTTPTQTFRVPRGHVFSLVVGPELWHATGKEIRVFLPTPDGHAQFQVLMRPLVQDGAGEVTCGTVLPSDPDKVVFGHVDGKVSIYSCHDHSCRAVLSLSASKINTLAGVGTHLWAGYYTGRICVYDMGQTPWVMKKDWQAHEKESAVVNLVTDHAGPYRLGRYHVLSLGADNVVRAWDGLLQDDWLEDELRDKDESYCEFSKVKVLVMTWNAGAATPNSLRYSHSDSTFFRDLLTGSGSPDVLVFGFQELVDLEDKTATAKRFFRKKKEGRQQEGMSHQYRDWRDHLIRNLDDFTGDLYHLLPTPPLVGLFTCVFVKAELRPRISKLGSAQVKCGMGGLYGNKGAITVRFMVDDTSLCLVNCHLAAGQAGTKQRNADIATILDAPVLPPELDPAVRMNSYVGGGDGSMILDHEMCLLNGDLNYRIDTMSRDSVVKAVKAGNLAKLLERDQLLVTRRRQPGFKLRAFDELPITFAPTYKYDVGSDEYDTSEKRRSPAWCDRLLFRAGRKRIEQVDYKRHEVRVSDHRPVTGSFRLQVKKIDPAKRAAAWEACQQRWERVRKEEAVQLKLYYLIHTIGYDDETAQQIVQDRS